MVPQKQGSQPNLDFFLSAVMKVLTRELSHLLCSIFC
jgi:hypothetical protein